MPITAPAFPTGDNFAPALGASSQVQMNSTVAEFGNGYRQVVEEGLNSRREKWTLSWTNIPIADGTTITNFLDSRGTHERFFWTPPKTGAAQMLVRLMGSYTESYSHTENVVTISAVFEEQFDV